MWPHISQRKTKGTCPHVFQCNLFYATQKNTNVGKPPCKFKSMGCSFGHKLDIDADFFASTACSQSIQVASRLPSDNNLFVVSHVRDIVLGDTEHGLWEHCTTVSVWSPVDHSGLVCAHVAHQRAASIPNPSTSGELALLRLDRGKHLVASPFGVGYRRRQPVYDQVNGKRGATGVCDL